MASNLVAKAAVELAPEAALIGRYFGGRFAAAASVAATRASASAATPSSATPAVGRLSQGGDGPGLNTTQGTAAFGMTNTAASVRFFSMFGGHRKAADPVMAAQLAKLF
ncbi:hypothetical protein HYH03_010744 [Edaphochlamys debaryana]|uniref:Uncharacterized protein n=1 Tax=Edaphochlamys debaryana TaxID=47281 RepID=A0A835XXI4_9CHLO|nr:hypothetical protein HYH03_010744 [Edaphochlamys debaryana]|eukprot:KAG2490823.1 hypothetical protein HYH03_010744 [Edaphochlamys debaryana]